ncbi:hypothetical protein J3458_001972 [Metarhizium acridum]|uniref:uncharacterized protein n=1 Tax=Metarhizium acridum TaxID=92637 RepID=UPI001C6BBB7E|nr:hypothetical protein J3458_001972 [Metarhizium acridum]
MSMRIVPANSNPESFTHTSHTSSAPSAPGVHDTLRHGVGQSPYDAAGQQAFIRTPSRRPVLRTGRRHRRPSAWNHSVVHSELRSPSVGAWSSRLSGTASGGP